MVDVEDEPQTGEEEDYSKETSTVEVLDNRVVIVSPSQWLLLFALLAVVLFLAVWSIVGELTQRVDGWGIIGSKGSQLLSVDAPQHGIVRRVLVEAGSFVQKDDELLEVLEISNHAAQHFQRHFVRAPLAAKVITIATEAGRHVEKKQVLLRLLTSGDSPRGHLFLPFQDWQQVQTGQKALLRTFGAQSLEGTIVHVAETPQHREQIAAHWGEGVMLPPNSNVFYEVIFSLSQPLLANPTQRGYGWLLGNREQLVVGMSKQFSITVNRYAPLSLLFPWLGGVKVKQ